MTWGNPQNAGEWLAAQCLAPISLVYLSFLSLHKLFFAQRQTKLACPVISVGNITVGGTGKTPIIVDLARDLAARNIKVAILSRGYKRQKNSGLIVVSDGKGNFASLEESGDEPFMMAKMLPHVVVIVGSSRAAAGRKAIQDFGCELLLLDDGFQHWQLFRDCDIVLLDYNDEPQKDSLLPAGRLRETLRALSRAKHVVITKIPKAFDQNKIERLSQLIKRYSPQSQISLCQFEPSSIHQLIAGKWTSVELDKLGRLPLVAFCGLAKPESFINSLEELEVNIVSEVMFGDHHRYSESDLKLLQAELDESGAEYLITTRKDLIKLENANIAPRILALNVTAKWLGAKPDLFCYTKHVSSAEYN